jgi:methyl-accepting chemotaxis protein
MKYFKNLRLQGKLLVSILSVAMIIFTIAIVYIASTMRLKLLNEVKQLVASESQRYANQVMAELNTDFDLSKGMSYSLWSFRHADPQTRTELFNDIMYQYIEKNPHFFSTWVSWEIRAVDPLYTLPYGRVRYTWYREKGSIKFKTDTLNLAGDDLAGLYYAIKQSKKITLTNPYPYSYSGKKEDEMLEVSACIPIIWDGEFMGLGGTDIVLDRFQSLITTIKPYEGKGYVFLIANDGQYVGHPDAAWVGKNIKEVWGDFEQEHQIVQNIISGQQFSMQTTDPLNREKVFISFAPVNIGQTGTPWSFAVVVPVDYIYGDVNKANMTSLLVGLTGLIILGLVIFYIARSISKPLQTTTIVLKSISEGDLNKDLKVDITTNDEIGEMAQAMNALIDGLNDTTGFAREIGKGNLEAEFSLMSDKDILGKALLEMRQSLKKAAEEEDIRKIENQKRNWTTQGQARFAEILRFNNDNIHELSFNVLKNLVKYLNATQGGMFVVNDEDALEKGLEMTACYAYDRKKFIQKHVMMGEGLIGACYQEQKTIYMTQVPENYIHITSGLGEGNPRCILIVPLKLNEQIYGVLELASFSPFQEHEIEFVEKVAESIASTISTVKINIRTALLLQQSQEQAEQMRAQEEEMRQNMEEMHATQEEMARKEMDLQTQTQTINNFMSIMEYDNQGLILKVNSNFTNLYGYSEAEILGKHISILFDNKNYDKSENYLEFWRRLRSGNHVSGVLKRICKDGSGIIIKGITNPVKDKSGSFIRNIEFTVEIG